MLIDLTLSITPERYRYIEQSGGREGHLGTHFDVMDKEFPLESFRTTARLIDISGMRDREVEVEDIVSHGLAENESVLFYTGYLEELGFETPAYWRRSAELSDAVVTYLIEKKVRLIGVDAAGAQKPKKHVAVDQRCADNNLFIIENMDNFGELRKAAAGAFQLYTAPLKRSGLTGLPCRVVADLG
jgi:kynurenine formamidase